jgi:exodeoxyribonuclease VII large subunit
MESLSLFELNALVKRSLSQCLPDEYWVQAELSDVRSNSTGHCYLEFIQKDPRSNNLVAKARPDDTYLRYLVPEEVDARRVSPHA